MGQAPVEVDPFEGEWRGLVCNSTLELPAQLILAVLLRPIVRGSLAGQILAFLSLVM
jgi:hypothetical protein